MRKYAHPRVIHPGRGYAMNGDELLDRQVAYLQDYQKAVAEFYSGGNITDPDRQSIAAVLCEAYTEYPMDALLNEGIDAEWRQLREQDHMMMGEQSR
jgi:hypothetical protein